MALVGGSHDTAEPARMGLARALHTVDRALRSLSWELQGGDMMKMAGWVPRMNEKKITCPQQFHHLESVWLI